MKKLFIIILAIICYLPGKSQAYNLQDIAASIKAFGSHIFYFEENRILSGTYDSVSLDRSYIMISLKGELRIDSIKSGSLYQVISFDARDISNDVTVVPREFGGKKDRWDVVLRTKKNQDLIHFRNYQTNNYGVSVINEQQDRDKVTIMFTSADAANRFKNIAKSVFK